MLRSISRRNLISKFHKLGREGPLAGGKHQFMTKDQLKVLMSHLSSGSFGKQGSAKKNGIEYENTTSIRESF